MIAVGWTFKIRVCIRVMRHGRLGTIGWADRLAILTLGGCHAQTQLVGKVYPLGLTTAWWCVLYIPERVSQHFGSAFCSGAQGPGFEPSLFLQTPVWQFE